MMVEIVLVWIAIAIVVTAYQLSRVAEGLDRIWHTLHRLVEWEMRGKR